MRLLLDHIDCPSQMSLANVALQKVNVALRNEHMTGSEKNGNKNVALENSNVARKCRSDVAQKFKHIT